MNWDLVFKPFLKIIVFTLLLNILLVGCDGNRDSGPKKHNDFDVKGPMKIRYYPHHGEQLTWDRAQGIDYRKHGFYITKENGKEVYIDYKGFVVGEEE